MLSKKIRQKYINFFKEKGHTFIPSSSLIPENDPTVLFTTAGMHPLVPFLMGEPHPQGKKLVNCQKCLRTGDIDEVGDSSHLTFFEMLGNWSLGDYFKKEAISWSFEFLTGAKWLGIDRRKIFVSCFKGGSDAPRDTESKEIWKSLGIGEDRIYYFGKKENWWGPAGQTGPCGPDTEMFYDTGKEKCGKNCNPSCSCGKYFEIWNDVFMQHNKTSEGKFEPLSQKNVDTGMGLERITAVMQGKESVFETDLFEPIILRIKELMDGKENKESIRIIADHMRAATFIMGDEKGIIPSNLDQGYILRRLIRRAIRHGKKIGVTDFFTSSIARVVIDFYCGIYPELKQNEKFILENLDKEEAQFEKTIHKGMREFEKNPPNNGKDAFYLFETYGFPIEMTKDLLKEKGIDAGREFEKEFEKSFSAHQKLSRKGAEGKFKGGLQDHSKETTRLHTATHMLQAALRRVLGGHVSQRGSNITSERLRFDFSHNEKMTDRQIKQVEDIVNKKIDQDLPVTVKQMPIEEAKNKGAIGVFGNKYGDNVKVYEIPGFSCEICGGPHVKRTGELGRFKIKKEESSSAGVRRIKAVLMSDK